MISTLTLARGAVLAALALLSACASQAPVPGSSAGAGGQTGLDLLERLTLSANRCWIRSGDPAFSRYSIAPELSSFSGRPRFLLVPKGRLEERPLLVVEGQSGSGDVSLYGPLMGGDTASRIRGDIERWSDGAHGCSA